MTDAATVLGRTKIAVEKWKPMANAYRLACCRFADPTDNQPGDEYADETDGEPGDTDLPVGLPNSIRINIQTKCDTIAIGEPDWDIRLHEDAEDLQELALEAVRKAWEACRLQRSTRRSLLNRFVGKVGIMAYYYDAGAGGCVFEHVKYSDFAPDPHFLEYEQLRYACRRILLPRDVAREKFPKYAAEFGKGAEPKNGADALKTNAIEMYVYWDKDTEVHLWKDKELQRDENRYGEIPLIFLEGDIAPDSPYDTGDYDNTYGLQVMSSELIQEINRQATAGGPLNGFNPNLFVGPSLKALQRGKPGSYLAVEGGKFAQALHRYPAEQPSPILNEALLLMQRGIDEGTAVTPAERGSPGQAQFATQALAADQLSGARGSKAQVAYEHFINKIVMKMVEMAVKWEIPKGPQQEILHLAFASIVSLKVVEASTTYKNPSAAFNNAVMFGNAALQFAQAGVPVNLPQVWLDICRAAQKRQVQKYIVAPQPQPPMMAPPQQGVPGQPAPPGAPMAMPGTPPPSAPVPAQGGVPPLPAGTPVPAG